MSAELEQRASEWSHRANGLTVQSHADVTAAAEMRNGILALRDEARLHHQPIIEAAHKTHKAALAARDKITLPLESAAAILATKMTAWKRAEDERIENERRRIEEEQRQRQTEAALASAIEAEAAGASVAEVEAVLDETSVAVASHVVPTPKVTGASFREAWACEVTSMVQFVQGIKDGVIGQAYVLPNMPALNQRARAERNTFKLPGCKAVRDDRVARR